MELRTLIEVPRPRALLDHGTPVLLLGSCFTDEVGQRLENDGFEVCRNPFGPLYNPMSLATLVKRASNLRPYTADDLTEGPRGWHCLDFASRFSGADSDALLSLINTELERLHGFMLRKPVAVITLGSSYVYRMAATDTPVGNCHKFPASDFIHSRLSVEEATSALNEIVDSLNGCGIKEVIFTVSPIRHLAYGLHGNQLGKATLLLAVDNMQKRSGVGYFPSYEIVLDDLRDYRFYGRDMKHPSDLAVDYIYEKFSTTYMDKATLVRALECRKAHKAANHRSLF